MLNVKKVHHTNKFNKKKMHKNVSIIVRFLFYIIYVLFPVLRVTVQMLCNECIKLNKKFNFNWLFAFKK